MSPIFIPIFVGLLALPILGLRLRDALALLLLLGGAAAFAILVAEVVG